MFRTHYLFLIALIFTAENSFSQTKNEYNEQQWIQYYNQLTLNQKWMVLSDAGFRWKNHFQTPSLYIFRTGLVYNINNSLHFGFAIANLGSFDNRELTKLEYRGHQEVVHKYQFEKSKFQQRLRVEERLFYPYKDGIIKANNQFNFRIRYRIQLIRTLFKPSINGSEKAVLLNLANEFFLNAGHNLQTDVFDQNRIIIGSGLQWNKNLILNLNYNLQFSRKEDLNKFDHVIWVSFNHSLSCLEKK